MVPRIEYRDPADPVGVKNLHQFGGGGVLADAHDVGCHDVFGLEAHGFFLPPLLRTGTTD
jgi:hypothetical protein